MDQHFEQDTQETTVAHSLGEIARAAKPPPARLPSSEPAHIQATTGDSNSKAALVLGIISLCLPIISFPVAVLGIIFGLLSPDRDSTNARIGIILNAIALGISVIGGIILLIVAAQSWR